MGSDIKFLSPCCGTENFIHLTVGYQCEECGETFNDHQILEEVVDYEGAFRA